MREIFETYSRSVDTLIQNLPRIHEAAAIQEPLEEMPGWHVFLGRPRAFVESGGRPVLVGTLFGASGSGKSAIFRSLTGIPVPSSLSRPTSFNCIVAAPQGIVDRNDVQKLFPSYRIEVIENFDVLRDPSRKEDELFCAFYNPSQANDHTVNLVLADVPDFNSVEKRNWHLAEQMLARAEVVVFVTFEEGFKDESVINFLVKACRGAGHLVYVLNKTSQENAPIIWDDLLNYTQNAERFSEKRRSDGLSFHEFLSKSPAYYLPFGRDNHVPGLDAMRPIRGEEPEFSSLLTGLDAGKVIMSSLMEVTPGGVATGRRILKKAERERERLSGIIETVSNQIVEQSKEISVIQFPIGAFIKLVVETAREQRPKFLKWKPIEIISGVVSRIGAGAVGLLLKFLRNKDENNLRQREDIESEKLRTATEALIDKWRSNNSNFGVSDLLSAEHCRIVRDSFLKKEPPSSGKEWDHFVREKILKWTQENPRSSRLMAVSTELFAIAGLATLTIDLSTFGLTYLFHASLAAILVKFGIVGGTATFLPKALQALHLESISQEARDEWIKIRAKEIETHIQGQFADPLFINALKENLAILQSESIQECLDACSALEQLEQKFTNNDER